MLEKSLGDAFLRGLVAHRRMPPLQPRDFGIPRCWVYSNGSTQYVGRQTSSRVAYAGPYSVPRFTVGVFMLWA